MKKLIIILIGIFIIITSCEKKEKAIDNRSNATVRTKGIDCNESYLIKFDDTVSGLPHNTFENTFYEINLPDAYKVDGLRINVTFREPTNSELMTCTSQGPSYPQIFIINVN